MWYRHRRGRWGWGGFPIFFFLILLWSHSFFSILISMVILGFLFMLFRAIAASTSQPGITGIPRSQQPYQQPYQLYQPYQPQSSTVYEEPPFEPYQQGYQQQSQQAQESDPLYSDEHPAYQQYEQPLVEYPQEELPPMEQ
jgi:hypothetical protein